MIYGIGTDIVDLARIESSIIKFGDSFARKILSERELDGYSSCMSERANFLGKRFAAKEAFSKAVGTGIRNPLSFQNITILHDNLGKPIIHLAENLEDLIRKRRITSMHLTISDEKNLAAIAFVVLEGFTTKLN
jgi:holo-[acyl-carrier protein] synthase